MKQSTDPDPNETQSDRCSQQRHLWRHSTLLGVEHMRCPHCGAVHPNDLAGFLAATA